MYIRIENILNFEIEDNIFIPPISFGLFIIFIKPICFMCLLYTKAIELSSTYYLYLVIDQIYNLAYKNISQRSIITSLTDFTVIFGGGDKPDTHKEVFMI